MGARILRALCIYTDKVFVENAAGTVRISTPLAIPFGISMIATVLKKKGCKLDMLVLSENYPFKRNLREAITELNPDLVCFTSVASQYEFVKQVISEARALSPDSFLVMGGVHPTLDPENTIMQTEVDAICIGEGEEAVTALASQLESGQRPSGIGNLWIRQLDGQIQKNPQRPFIQDLDSLPFVDRSIWDKCLNDEVGKVAILIGRGCPNKCTYCSNHAIARRSSGRYVRMRSPEKIIEEIVEITGFYPHIKDHYLEVETLGANHKYLFELCQHLAEFNSKRSEPLVFGVNYSLNERVISDDELLSRIFASFRKAGITYVKIGIESGSERIREEVLRRPKYSNESVEKFCRYARESSIDVHVYLLMGLPGESLADYRETVKLVRKCQPAVPLVNKYYPYPGTDLYDYAKEKGYIIEGARVSERVGSMLRMPDFTPRQIRREFILFYIKVYFGHWPLLKIINYTLIAYLRSSDSRFYSAFVKIKKLLKRMKPHTSV